MALGLETWPLRSTSSSSSSSNSSSSHPTRSSSSSSYPRTHSGSSTNNGGRSNIKGNILHKIDTENIKNDENSNVPNAGDLPNVRFRNDNSIPLSSVHVSTNPLVASGSSASSSVLSSSSSSLRDTNNDKGTQNDNNKDKALLINSSSNEVSVTSIRGERRLQKKTEDSILDPSLSSSSSSSSVTLVTGPNPSDDNNDEPRTETVDNDTDNHHHHHHYPKGRNENNHNNNNDDDNTDSDDANTPSMDQSRTSSLSALALSSTDTGHRNGNYSREGKLAYLWDNSLVTIAEPKDKMDGNKDKTQLNNDIDEDDSSSASSSSPSTTSSDNENDQPEEEEEELFTASGRRKRIIPSKNNTKVKIQNDKRSRNTNRNTADDTTTVKAKSTESSPLISSSPSISVIPPTIAASSPTVTYLTPEYRKLLSIIEQNAFEHIIGLQEPGWVAVHDIVAPYALRRLICNAAALRLFRWTQAEIDARIRLQKPIRWLHPDYVIDRSFAEVQARKEGDQEFTINGTYLRRKLAIERTFEREQQRDTNNTVSNERTKSGTGSSSSSQRRGNSSFLPSIPMLASVPWRNLRNFNLNNSNNSPNNGMDPVLSYAINGPLAHALAASSYGNDDEVIFVLEDIDDGAAYIPFSATESVTIEYLSDPFTMQAKVPIKILPSTIETKDSTVFPPLDLSLRLTHIVTTVFKNIDPKIMNTVSPLHEIQSNHHRNITTNKIPVPNYTVPTLITNILADTSLSASMVMDSITNTPVPLPASIDPSTGSLSSSAKETVSTSTSVTDSSSMQKDSHEGLITQDSIEAAEERECMYEDSSDDDIEESIVSANAAAEVNAVAIAAAAMAAQLQNRSRTDDKSKKSVSNSNGGKPSFLSTYVHRPYVPPRSSNESSSVSNSSGTKSVSAPKAPNHHPRVSLTDGSSDDAMVEAAESLVHTVDNTDYYHKANMGNYSGYHREVDDPQPTYNAGNTNVHNTSMEGYNGGYNYPSSAYIMGMMHQNNNSLMNNTQQSMNIQQDPMYVGVNMPMHMYNQYSTTPNMYMYPPIVPLMDTGRLNANNNYRYRGASGEHIPTDLSPSSITTKNKNDEVGNKTSSSSSKVNASSTSTTIIPPTIPIAKMCPADIQYQSSPYYYNPNTLNYPTTVPITSNYHPVVMHTANNAIHSSDNSSGSNRTVTNMNVSDSTTGNGAPTYHNITAGGYTLTTLPPLPNNNNTLSSGYYNGVSNMMYPVSHRSLTENMMPYMMNNNYGNNNNSSTNNPYGTKFNPSSFMYNSNNNGGGMNNHHHSVTFTPPSTMPVTVQQHSTVVDKTMSFVSSSSVSSSIVGETNNNNNSGGLDMEAVDVLSTLASSRK